MEFGQGALAFRAVVPPGAPLADTVWWCPLHPFGVEGSPLPSRGGKDQGIRRFGTLFLSGLGK